MAAPEQHLNYQQIRQILTRAVARICPDWLRSQQEDLIQSAMEKVFSLQQRSEGNRQFNSSYLAKIAHSVLVDEIRSQQRRQEVPLEEQAVPESPVSPSSTPAAMHDWHALNQAIRQCLQRLVETRRQAVTLHLQGHSVADTAGFLGWTYKKAENCVYRGLADLRECLKGKGY